MAWRGCWEGDVLKIVEPTRNGINLDDEPYTGPRALWLVAADLEQERQAFHGSNRVVLWLVAALAAWLAVLLLLRAGAGL